MNMRECRSYEGCNTPLCPVDDATCNIAVWYPDEEICGSMLFRKERWRIAQRKIAKRTRNIDSFFTLAMLNAVIVVGKGIKGASPYRSEELMAERQSTFIKGRVAGDHSAVQISTANPLSSLETRNSNPSPTVPMVYEQEKE